MTVTLKREMYGMQSTENPIERGIEGKIYLSGTRERRRIQAYREKKKRRLTPKMNVGILGYGR